MGQQQTATESTHLRFQIMVPGEVLEKLLKCYGKNHNRDRINALMDKLESVHPETFNRIGRIMLEAQQEK